MAVSFIRVDDRMIHGQTCTRWALEYPCDGLIAVNNAAAKNPVLKAAYKSASGKKPFVWSVDEFKEKSAKVLASKDNYFLITKNSSFDSLGWWLPGYGKDPDRPGIPVRREDRDHRTLQRQTGRNKTRKQPVHYAGRSAGT